MATIVMTGATSGIGRVAAETLLGNGAKVIVGARAGGVPTGAVARSLDLADLTTVRAFAATIDEPIDALVLNAGIQFQTVAHRSAQGYETTFAVNHLAHYLLARLLLDRIVDGGRIVITSSGTHDPVMKTMVPPPRHADAVRLADPASDPDLDASPTRAGFRAYSTSKLCNLMTARSLAARPEVNSRRIVVHAYDPGFIPETGLKRDAGWPMRAAATLLSILPPMKIANRQQDGGAGLAGLADGSIRSDRVYMSLRRAKVTWPDPSVLACDDAACAKLWIDSAALVGLEP